jgi:dihydropyrimidinase
MAEYTGAPIYFVHQSTPGAVDLVRAARNRGLSVYSETCPHYLVLDDGVYASTFPEWFACCPPMRSTETVAAVRERYAHGDIDTVSSDHSCYDLTQKRRHDTDIRQMPHGLPGVETRMPVAFTALADALGDPCDPGVLRRFAEVFAATPARINAIPGKGALAPGYDADLVVFDRAELRRVTALELHQGTDFSPFEGRMLRGWPQVVVSGGRIMLRDGQFHDPGPVGRFLPRRGYRETNASTATSTSAPTTASAAAPAGGR